MELVHGGDWAGYRARFGHDALDFSANVSPLGLPQGVADAIVAALPTADRYPDPLCRELRTALSRAEQLPEPWILCGNGAADLIYRLVWALKPRRALLPAAGRGAGGLQEARLLEEVAALELRALHDEAYDGVGVEVFDVQPVEGLGGLLLHEIAGLALALPGLLEVFGCLCSLLALEVVVIGSGPFYPFPSAAPPVHEVLALA